MNSPSPSLEPLADYLQSQFGDIYDYNFNDEGQWEVQEWTDDLKQAVKDYLMGKAPEDLKDQVLDTLAHAAHDTDRREQRIDSIIAQYEPWEIAHAFHEAAVIAVPTLRALIGHLDHWPYEDERMDAILGLDKHATGNQLRQVVKVSGNRQTFLLAHEHAHSNPAAALVRTLEPPALEIAPDEPWSRLADSE